MKTAIVIGATGLVGSALVNLLLKYNRFEKVKVFVRRSTGIEHPKLEEYIVNFGQTDGWKKLVTGDVLYSALGTTLRKAGNKDAQYEIDYTYQYNVAKIAATNDVKTYVLISAAGSSPSSKIFYSRMKGELERDVKKLPFQTIHVIRPGMLAGARKELRLGEQVGVSVMNVVSMIPGLNRLKPTKADDVAQAMINATFRPVEGIHSYTLGGVSKLAHMTR